MRDQRIQAYGPMCVIAHYPLEEHRFNVLIRTFCKWVATDAAEIAVKMR